MESRIDLWIRLEGKHHDKLKVGMKISCIVVEGHQLSELSVQKKVTYGRKDYLGQLSGMKWRIPISQGERQYLVELHPRDVKMLWCRALSRCILCLLIWEFSIKYLSASDQITCTDRETRHSMVSDKTT